MGEARADRFQSVFAMAGMIERGGHVGMLIDE